MPRLPLHCNCTTTVTTTAPTTTAATNCTTTATERFNRIFNNNKITVLGQLPRRKIVPNPKINQGAIFLGDNSLVAPTPLKLTLTLTPNPNPNRTGKFPQWAIVRIRKITCVIPYKKVLLQQWANHFKILTSFFAKRLTVIAQKSFPGQRSLGSAQT